MTQKQKLDKIYKHLFSQHTMRIKLISDGAKLPTKGTEKSSAFDVYLPSDISVPRGLSRIALGISAEVPGGFDIWMLPRSSTAKKYGLVLANSIGVIDEDYRGEIGADVYCDKDIQITKGTRLFQLIPKRKDDFTALEVDELSETDRGAGGFGSTGS